MRSRSSRAWQSTLQGRKNASVLQIHSQHRAWQTTLQGCKNVSVLQIHSRHRAWKSILQVRKMYLCCKFILNIAPEKYIARSENVFVLQIHSQHRWKNMFVFPGGRTNIDLIYWSYSYTIQVYKSLLRGKHKESWTLIWQNKAPPMIYIFESVPFLAKRRHWEQYRV